MIDNFQQNSEFNRGLLTKNKTKKLNKVSSNFHPNDNKTLQFPRSSSEHILVHSRSNLIRPVNLSPGKENQKQPISRVISSQPQNRKNLKLNRCTTQNMNKTTAEVAWSELSKKINQINNLNDSDKKIINRGSRFSQFLNHTDSSYNRLSNFQKRFNQTKSRNRFFKKHNPDKFSKSVFIRNSKINQKIYETACRQYTMKNGTYNKKTAPNFFKKINKKLATVQYSHIYMLIYLNTRHKFHQGILYTDHITLLFIYICFSLLFYKICLAYII